MSPTALTESGPARFPSRLRMDLVAIRGVPIRRNSGLPVRAESPVFPGRCVCYRVSRHVVTRKGRPTDTAVSLPVRPSTRGQPRPVGLAEPVHMLLDAARTLLPRFDQIGHTVDRDGRVSFKQHRANGASPLEAGGSQNTVQQDRPSRSRRSAATSNGAWPRRVGHRWGRTNPTVVVFQRRLTCMNFCPAPC